MFGKKIMRATETAVAGMILVSLGGLVVFSDTPLAGQEFAEADLTVLEMTTPETPSTEVALSIPNSIGLDELVEEAAEEPGPPEGSLYEVFEATAYCDFGLTYSGVLVHRGIVAADPRVLPIGSVIEVSAGQYSGIYTVMDTGGVVKGEIIDIYMPDYEEAIQFGRQSVGVRVIRRGWQPVQISSFEYTV
ncbi:MAG TPA: 3D domain-containing protein, partial [Acidobacteriota bacterium]|nr:3D domain-containing protein [Acidobacteriota bacterium]